MGKERQKEEDREGHREAMRAQHEGEDTMMGLGDSEHGWETTMLRTTTNTRPPSSGMRNANDGPSRDMANGGTDLMDEKIWKASTVPNEHATTRATQCSRPRHEDDTPIPMQQHPPLPLASTAWQGGYGVLIYGNDRHRGVRPHPQPTH